MVAPSTRQLHRRNLRGGGPDVDDGGSSDVSDEFKDDFKDEPPLVAGRGFLPSHHAARPPRPSSMIQSTAVMAALADEDSQLARFLFLGAGGGNDQRGTSGRPNDQDDGMPRMRTLEVASLALALEPMEARSVRIVQLFEAYAIFGALFMNGVWIIYEWGSAKGYGGDVSTSVQRAFECIMALLLCCNILLAMNAAWMWIVSIATCGSNEEFVLKSTNQLMLLQSLLYGIVYLLFGGLALGVYTNLYPNVPETAVTLAIAIGIFFVAAVLANRQMVDVAPLECYHLPLWLRLCMPQLWRREEREDLKVRAKQRAQYLEKRAYHERKRRDPKEREVMISGDGSLGTLLYKAAMNLGRIDEAVYIYEARLEKDWFTEACQLRGRSVECLARYMPLRLAEEVARLVESEYAASECNDGDG